MHVAVRKIFLLGLAVWCGSTGAALAEDLTAARPDSAAPATEIAYEARWTGFHIADVTIALDDRPDRYAATMRIRPVGILRSMSDFNATIEAEGRLEDHGATVPTAFRRAWKSTEKEGEVVVAYDPASGIAQGIEDGKPQEKVGEALRRAVIDPLAILVAMRHALRAGKTGALLYPAFDGKRRFDLEGKVGAPFVSNIDDVLVPVIPMELTFKPIAGFNSVQRRGWRDAVFEVKFTDDARLVPYQIYLDTLLGRLVLTLVGEGVPPYASPSSGIDTSGIAARSER